MAHEHAARLAVGQQIEREIDAIALARRDRARLGIRFNTLHSSKTLEAWIRRTLDAIGGNYALDVQVSGEAFLTPPGAFSALVAAAVEAETGQSP